MLNKISSSVLIVILLSSLLGPSFAVAEKNINLTYDQVMQELDIIKNDIENGENLPLSKKEKIVKDSYEMVNTFVDANEDLSNEMLDVLIDSLEEIDSLLYNVNIEKGNTLFGSKSINFKKSEENQGTLGNDDGKISILSNEVGGGSYWYYKGDILISQTAKTYLPHGHAAICSTVSNYVYEAMNPAGVVHQPASKYWSTVYDEEQYYVRGASDAAYLKAVEYAKSQLGEPYEWKSSLDNTSKWYCSKLVYKAWRSAGFNVGGSGYLVGYVLPADIRLDYDTVRYTNRWNMY